MHHINQDFVCIICGHHVSPASVSCRNHCPFCFASLHVDDQIPGDRASTCHSIMLPDYYIYHPKKIDIHFLCIKCGHEHHNKQSPDDHIELLDDLIAHYRYAIATSTIPTSMIS